MKFGALASRLGVSLIRAGVRLIAWGDGESTFPAEIAEEPTSTRVDVEEPPDTGEVYPVEYSDEAIRMRAFETIPAPPSEPPAPKKGSLRERMRKARDPASG